MTASKIYSSQLQPLLLVLVLIFSCKESTKPANCDPGFAPCISNETVCCADTTSHNFIWEIDTLGVSLNSWANVWDVSILSDDDIWVSGTMPINPQEWQLANCAHWNGSEWELFEVSRGPGGYSPDTFYTIYAVDENNIWGMGPFLFNGTEWIYLNASPSDTWDSDGYIYDTWGNSPDNVYFSGGTGYEAGIGTVVHWNGSVFTKINPGTNSVLKSISGNSNHIYTCGNELYSTPLSEHSVLYEYDEDSWSIILESHIYYGNIENNDFGLLKTLTCISDTLYVKSYAGLIKYNINTRQTVFLSDNEINAGSLEYVSISGNSPSDIMIFGQGIYLHYNGIDWYRDDTMFNSYFGSPNNLGIRAGQLKGDTAVFTGHMGGYAIVIRGHRVD